MPNLLSNKLIMCLCKFFIKCFGLKKVFFAFNPKILKNNKQVAYEGLFLLDKIFKEHSVSYWIDFGTLLGFVRDGDFLDHDVDVDISLFFDDFSEGLFDDITKEFKLKKSFSVISDIIQKFNLNLSEENGISFYSFNYKGVVFDLSLFIKDEQLKSKNRVAYCIICGEYPRVFEVPESMLLSFSTINIKGNPIPIPKNVEAYLDCWYTNWKEPKKYYRDEKSFVDILLTYPNLIYLKGFK